MDASPTDPDRRCVVLSGATGLVGSALLERLAADGVDVRALSRSPSRLAPAIDRTIGAPGLVRAVAWDGRTPPPEVLDGSSAIVHLAGEPVFGGLPTAARRERIRTSRVDSTRDIVRSIAALPQEQRPSTFVCASAVGYYGSRGEEALPEDARPGTGFLADVCREWEAEAIAAEDLGLRVVRLRIGLVMARDGGALALMRLPFGLGLGGRLGDGQQWMPWIDLDDLVRLIAFALGEEISGAVNACAPEPVRNVDFTRALATTLSRPAFLPVPGFAVRAALGDLAGELLGSRRTVASAAARAGFEFECTRVEESLARQLG